MCIKWKRRGKMKKQVKKFMSALLACVMVAVSVIVFDMNPVHAASGAITEASGWLETAYVKWTPVTGATGYNVYVKSASASDSAYVQLDDELIRKYPSYMRADAVGLKAGDYVMKIVPLNNGKENTSAAIVSDKLTVNAHDRSGFTFSSNSPVKNGVGAYNNDGTLKSNASVLYVTEANKNTVKMKIGNTEYTGVAAITQAIKAKSNCQPVAIRIIGQVTLSGLACKDVSSAYAIGVKGAANVTFEGIGDDATLYGAGVAVFQSTGIEVRNLGLMNWGGGKDGDGISLKQSLGVWVHNNDVFYGNAGSDGDQAKGDGSMDLKDNSQYVTVSYNHFWDSGKMSLCGMKSESGENWITYHHNWFDHSDSRHPRIRTMSVYVYNNYYDGNSKYGVGAAKDSEAFVEANYFRNCNYPMLSSMQGSDVLAGGIFSGENGGVIKAYNNYMEGQKSVIYANSDTGTTSASATDFDAYLAASRSETVPSTYKAKQGGKTYSNFDTKVDLGVDTADIDAPADVPSIVTKYAGRVMGGDFKWTFDNSVDDTSYSLNRPLKDKLNAYKTSLVSVGGGSVSGTSHTHTYGEWTVVKAATETETGLKSRTCTVCGYNETAVIPAIGKDTPVTPDTPESGDAKVHNFTESGTTSDFYSITGSIATNKGTATYNGLTLTKCLKMESSTSIKFTAPSAGKLTLVFGGTTAASGKGVKVNGTSKKVGSDGTLTVDVAKGAVTVTKGDAINLFYMVYTPSGTPETTHTHKYESKITKQATCTEAGVLTYTCTSTTGTCDKKTYTETIPATGHKFSTEWTVDVEATETTPGSKSHHCTVCDAKTDVTEIPATGVVEKKNGLYCDDGTWNYYKNNGIDTEYVGLAVNENGIWYVSKGTIDWTYTGMVEYDNQVYYVKNGGVNREYTGLINVSDEWRYISKGRLDKEYKGLVNNEYGWWYVSEGTIDWTYTGLVQVDADWWYVTNGAINFGYTGLIENEYGWWYITNGQVNFAYSGLVNNENGWWYVTNGRIDWTFTGLVENEYGWWYVINGGIDFSYTGLVENEYGWWYVVNSGIDFGYTGTATNEFGTWNVVNGHVEF
jgi:pectate lyase